MQIICECVCEVTAHGLEPIKTDAVNKLFEGTPRLEPVITIEVPPSVGPVAFRPSVTEKEIHWRNQRNTMKKKVLEGGEKKKGMS